MSAQAIKNIVPAIYAALNVSALQSLIASYGAGYAIFTGRVVPTNATKPFIHIRPNMALSEFDCKQVSGWEYEFEVVIINDEPESTKNHDIIVDKVLELLDDVSLSITGANHVLTHCVGLLPAQVSDDLVGSVLRFRTTINN